jgi:hypothetical protein
MGPPPTIEAVYSDALLTAESFAHPDWDRTQPVLIQRRWSGERAREAQYAEARLLWTNEALLVRFDCQQDEPLNVRPNPQLQRKTLRLWETDVCEIFLAPDSDTPEHYFEFEASPQGEWVDLAIRITPERRERDFDFQSGMRTATVVQPDRIIVCMEIPWSDVLPKPAPENLWRVNLFRCAGVGDERYLAWIPTYTKEPSFHVPEVFGWLKFV